MGVELPWGLRHLIPSIYDLKVCGATLILGDDHGDNSCTFRCAHRYGHIGLHGEVTSTFKVMWERYRDDRLPELHMELEMAIYHIRGLRERFTDLSQAYIWKDYANEALNWALVCFLEEVEYWLVFEELRRHERALKDRIRVAQKKDVSR